MPNGYDHIYQTLLPQLRACDLGAHSPRLGLTHENGVTPVTFLGRAYHIANDGIHVADGGEAASVNTLSVIAYYILSEGAGEPGESFTPLFRLTGMPEGRNAQTRGLMTEPMARAFGNDPSKLREAVKTLGGWEVQPDEPVRHVFRLRPLPQLPVEIVLYEPDDEFPAEAQMRFDKTAPRFMAFECLAFYCGCVVTALLNTARFPAGER
jgi:hypothetical protein